MLPQRCQADSTTYQTDEGKVLKIRYPLLLTLREVRPTITANTFTALLSLLFDALTLTKGMAVNMRAFKTLEFPKAAEMTMHQLMNPGST